MSTKPKHPNLPPRHPLSAIFPEHGGEPLALLAKSIQEEGQEEDILLFEGMILDGWRRGLACERAGIEPRFSQFIGTHLEAARLVWRKNFHRRHLGIGDIPLVAARYKQYLRDHPEEAKANGETLGGVAEKFGTSKSSLEAAEKVLNKAEPEVVEAVEQGKVSVSDAAKIANEKPAVQRSAVKDVIDRLDKSTNTAAKAAAKIKSPNGQVVFDDKQITEPYGKLMRACVSRWQSMGSKDDPGFRAVKEALGVAYQAMQSWGIK